MERRLSYQWLKKGDMDLVREVNIGLKVFAGAVVSMGTNPMCAGAR
jgi:hypothetical protein